MIELSYLVLTFLTNALWQVTLIAVVALCGARLLRRTPARYRHALWAAALFLGLVLPVSSLQGIGPKQLSRVEYAPTTAGQTRAVSPTPARRPEVRAAAAEPTLSLGMPLTLGAVGLYVLFLLYRSARLWLAWSRTKAIRRAAYPAAIPAPLETVLKRYRAELGVGRSDLFFSRSVNSPLTVGVLRPAVILPERLLTEAPAEVLAAALGHELAHVRRRDFACNLVYELLFLPLSFHPAAVLLKRGIARTRELACDELVSERLMDARSYARSLVDLAGAASSASPATYALGINDADILEERVMRLMNRSERRGVRSGRALALFTVAALCAACVVAGSLSVRVSGSEQVRDEPAKQSGGAAAQGLSPNSLLRGAMELNRAGRWHEAARLAEAVTQAPAANHAERCEAYVSGAYSYQMLKEADRALGAVKLFEGECADLPDSSWQRQEARRISSTLHGIAPATATDLNRAGEWAEAAAAAERVLSAGGVSHAERCAAHVDAAFAYVRLRKRELATGQLKQFAEGCSDLPADDWRRAEVRRLKAEVE
ncbi:MAG TPA: M56 family metallopeptidase [Pyrinomonadaceae bacterium]|nr:M56 family metallopeptidase [Pyrinomonadaceae bacterium]